MLSKGKSKTTKERAWLDTVCKFAHDTQWLNVMYGNYCNQPYEFQIDHLLGAQAKRKINGVSVKVGEFAIMPIPIALHDITSNHPLNRTLKPKAYRDTFGTEQHVFAKMIVAMERYGYKPHEFLGNEIIEAILR